MGGNKKINLNVVLSFNVVFLTQEGAIVPVGMRPT